MIIKLHSHSTPKVLADFKRSLEKSGASETTVKNYISDVRSFLASDEEKAYSPATIKRRNYAIKRYLEFTNSRRYQSFGVYALAALSILSLSAVSSHFFRSASPSVSYIEVNNPAMVPESNTINSNSKAIARLASSGTDDFIVLKTPPLTDDIHNSITDPLETTTSQSIESYAVSVGKSEIAANKKEALVLSNLVNDESFISLTANSPTNGQSLYVKSQGEGYFVVAIESSLEWECDFQWKVDNTEVYHSIF